MGWGRGSAQNASRFSTVAMDGDGRGRDLVDKGVIQGWCACFVLDIKASLCL